MKKYVSYLCILFVLVVASSVFAEVVEPMVAGDFRYDSGTIQAMGACPSWDIALERYGGDGGHLTVEFDGCQVGDFEVFSMVQGAPTGVLAVLEEDDIFVVWDEDAGHGSAIDFSFPSAGSNYGYTDVTNDTSDYVQAFRPAGDTRTNWKLYRVDIDGTLTVNATGLNEHDAFCLERNLIDVFEKIDDVSDGDCRSPSDEITYTICWENTSSQTFENAYLVDYLPEGVDYDWLISVMPSLVTDPNYNQENRTYTWQLRTLSPGDSGCVSLTVEVNEKAEPGMSVHNVAELRADVDLRIAIDVEDTPICCWADPNIIYVDITATGNNNGLSWANADSGEEGLQKALTRAKESTCDIGLYTINVATGTYNPGDSASSTFVIPEGTEVYGGFISGGSDESLRNPDTYETVLTGHRFIDTDPNEVYHYHIYNDTLVTMENLYVSDPNFPVNETSLLDGFTLNEATINGIYGTVVDFDIKNCEVADSGEYGIYAEGADVTIENSTVTDSGSRDGIHVENGDVVIKWCNIKDGGRYGIYHTGEGNVIAVGNSRIINNKKQGINCEYSMPTVKNSVVFGNGFSDNGFDGIRIYLPAEVPVLYNNTIIYNKTEGIDWFDDRTISDPNDKDYPDVQNNILWYNNDGASQVTGFDQDTYASYCGIQSCTEVNNNINDAPGFVLTFDPDDPEAKVNPYHYHLAYDSVCKDKGNPSHDTDDLGLYDIDGEDRLVNNRADIGADELYSCDDDLTEDDIYNSLDWNFDGIVNNYEFAEFAVWWLAHDPNDPGYTPDPEEYAIWSSARDYNFDKIGTSLYQIDVDDLMTIANDWAWIACWKQSQFDHFDSMVTAMATGGAESMMMTPMAMSSMCVAYETVPVPEPE